MAAELPAVFWRLAKQTAKEIMNELGATRAERVGDLAEAADRTNGHILARSALEKLLPAWDPGEVPGRDAVERFWVLFQPMVIEALKMELDPLRAAVKAEWDRRRKAELEGRQW